MSQLQTELEQRAAALASGPAFRDWAAFLDAFKKYTDGKRDLCVTSPIPTMQVVQGTAQECSTLYRLFEGAAQAAARRAPTGVPAAP